MAGSNQYSVSILFKVIDQATAKLANIGGSISGLGGKFAGVQSKFAEMNAGWSSMASLGESLTMKLTLPIAGIGLFAIKSAADIETLQISFETMLGSAAKAQQMVADIRKFAAETPFEMAGVGKAAKTLTSLNMSGKELWGNMKMLGDISAGVGIPIEELSQIFAKSANKGKLMGEELAQLSERNIPLVRILAKQMGKSTEEIYKMGEKGQITFPMMKAALASLTDKGGMYNNMMAKQSMTINGLWSTLKDNVKEAAGNIGEELIKLFDIKNRMQGAIKAIGDFGEKFKEFAKANPLMTKFIVGIVLLVAAIGPLLTIIGTLGVAFTALTAPMLPITITVLAITAAIIGLIAAYVYLSKEGNTVKSMIEEISVAFDNFWNSFRENHPIISAFFMPLAQAIMLTIYVIGQLNDGIQTMLASSDGMWDGFKEGFPIISAIFFPLIKMIDYAIWGIEKLQSLWGLVSGGDAGSALSQGKPSTPLTEGTAGYAANMATYTAGKKDVIAYQSNNMIAGQDSNNAMMMNDSINRLVSGLQTNSELKIRIETNNELNAFLDKVADKVGVTKINLSAKGSGYVVNNK